MGFEVSLAGEKNDDLRLCLSLGYGGNPIHNPFQSSIHGRGSYHETDPMDMKRVSTESEEERNDSSSPNSTLSSSISLRRRKKDRPVEADMSPRKKLRLSNDQSKVLQDAFKKHDTLNQKQKMAMAKQLNLRPRQVEVWFQNRRARIKLKKTEVETEKLKRWCEKLTAENMKLQKELMELRALKLSPQLYKHINSSSTPTMCSTQCPRLALSLSSYLSEQSRSNLES